MSFMHLPHCVGKHALAGLLGAFIFLAPALAQSGSGVTPAQLRGVWYPKSQLGAGQCARVQSEGLGELQSGALQISDTQIIDWKKFQQHTLVFVTDSRPRRRQTWRLQGLVDVYPYETSKVLETYIFELDQKELHWFKRSFDGVTERVDATVYERCL